MFVAIERTTRFVHIEIIAERSAATVAACMARFLHAFGHPVHTVLTDNGSEFTDRFGDARWRKRERGTGAHPFDRLCAAHAIAHKLTRPYHPQTNGMVERFNRRLAEAIAEPTDSVAAARKNRFTTPAERNAFLITFVRDYNRTRLRCLDYQAPAEALDNLTGHNTFAGTSGFGAVSVESVRWNRVGATVEWDDDAYVLSARAHGETGAIVDLLSAEYGRFAGHVAGGASRKIKPFLQPGARVIARYRARTSEQLGSLQLEPVGEGPASLFDDPLALAGLAAAAAVTAGALPEREAHPNVFAAFEALVSAFVAEDIWPAVFVRFEAGLLDDLGFGLDLSRCAATGVVDDLIYVSPRTGRAVSREAGEPYKDRMLTLPTFLLASQAPLRTGDLQAGFDLTGHFLAAHVFAPLNRPLPPARVWLLEKLAQAERL